MRRVSVWHRIFAGFFTFCRTRAHSHTFSPSPSVTIDFHRVPPIFAEPRITIAGFGLGNIRPKAELELSLDHRRSIPTSGQNSNSLLHQAKRLEVSLVDQSLR